jgi:hypothetical protein
MRKVNLLPKYFRLLIALSVCFVAGDLRAFVARSQDRSSHIPMIALEIVKDDVVKPNEPYRVGQQVRVRLIAKNESSEQIAIADINSYSQNRLELLRNGKLVPYRPQIAKVVGSIKDAEADMIGIGRQDFIIVWPYSSATIRIINLSDWYGSLDPGRYRLTNRFRNEIGGPWSADSKPVVFEVSR